MPITKIDSKKINTIRYLYETGSSTRELGKLYGVSNVQIWRIIHNLQRRKVPQVTPKEAQPLDSKRILEFFSLERKKLKKS